MRFFIGLAILFTGLQSIAYPGIDQCWDINNKPVSIQQTVALGQAAESNIINGLPTILLHPQMMGQYPHDVQQFIVAHECAHHRQGHVVRVHFGGSLPITSEFDADCMAIKTLKDLGLLNAFVLRNIQTFLSSLHADATHPGGTHRAQYAQQCAQ
ncbi:MAG: hypothetical protein OM95_12970 [Bdellovibrio sp. ArHS]|uniref:hypothetical protein n=1 Tax=Bdellovibrio sp. ArHS TaxID=1569284 RepID=UPI0005824686|nr:hypothetical protein [Bdellovibrio sp. ArHS]KHD87724.1 MAG: hypothetical protein OM95_12970 [Bdellovibrio sp. ArHS]